MSERKRVINEVQTYKRRFYLNKVVKGSILFFSSIISAFLIWNVLEFSFRFGNEVRAFFFFSFLGLTLFSIVYFLLDPLLVLLGLKKSISDEEAAKKVGEKYPAISDRLLNFIQLSKYSGNPLAEAGIDQKSSEIAKFSFSKIISFKSNTRYIKYLISPLTVVLIILFIHPAIFNEGTTRIINYNENYVPKAPFSFQIKSDLTAFKNEDYTLKLDLEGNMLPEEAYLSVNNRKIKLFRNENGLYTYTFNKIQYDKTVSFEAAGFLGPEVNIKVVERPNLKSFNIFLDYPAYTNKPDSRISNSGNLQIPEGTSVSWEFGTIHSNDLQFKLDKPDTVFSADKKSDQLFTYEQTFFNSNNYEIILNNEYSNNSDRIKYAIDVEKDQYPRISTNIYEDTLLYNLIILGGNISDDYGLRKLGLSYKVFDERNNLQTENVIPLKIDTRQNNQGYYYRWAFDSLDIQSGYTVNYFLQVWDNDKINGSKSSKTATYTYSLPTGSEIREEISESTKQTESKIDKTLQEAAELERRLKETGENLKGKKKLTWEDEKNLREIMDKREEINEALEELKKLNKENTLQRNRFTPQSESLKEKTEQLQQLMNELLDEETRQMYEELKKLLEENKGIEQTQQMMQKLNRKENNFKRELERTLELFKKLKLENEIEQAVNQLNKTAEEQLELAKETGEKDNRADKLLDEQKDISKKFEEIKESLSKINEMNQELKNPESMPDNTEEEKSISENLNESEEELEKLKQEEGKDSSESGNSQEVPKDSEKENSEGDSEESKSESGENSKTGENKEGGDTQESNESEQEDAGKNEEGENNESPQNKPSRERVRQKQNDAGRQMKKMAAKMQSMQGNMEMEMMTENVNDLRNILYNLLKLSFDQEELMNKFREVNESDPRFVDLSQKQLKLRDDSRIIEDSLMSLAERVFQIKSFVTREVVDMNTHMEKAMDALKERTKYLAVGEQQFAMTSMNNLALLLDDVLDQMLNSLAQMSATSKGNKGEKNKDLSLGELQEELNQRIEELKDSGKSGRELSEELANLAAEQERIRKALQEQLEKNQEDGESPGGNIPAQMEQSEIDLVNKNLTERLIRRQKAILTRLLEAENAMREKELDEERKGETANDYEKVIPESFEDYLKQKEQEVEMLKTLPPKLYPYYKKEVSEYFKRIGEGTKQMPDE